MDSSASQLKPIAAGRSDRSRLNVASAKLWPPQLESKDVGASNQNIQLLNCSKRLGQPELSSQSSKAPEAKHAKQTGRMTLKDRGLPYTTFGEKAIADTSSSRSLRPEQPLSFPSTKSSDLSESELWSDQEYKGPNTGCANACHCQSYLADLKASKDLKESCVRRHKSPMDYQYTSRQSPEKDRTSALQPAGMKAARQCVAPTSRGAVEPFRPASASLATTAHEQDALPGAALLRELEGEEDPLMLRIELNVAAKKLVCHLLQIVACTAFFKIS